MIKRVHKWLGRFFIPRLLHQVIKVVVTSYHNLSAGNCFEAAYGVIWGRAVLAPALHLKLTKTICLTG